MKHAAWAMVLMVGTTSCSGALIGGDAPGQAGAASGANLGKDFGATAGGPTSGSPGGSGSSGAGPTQIPPGSGGPVPLWSVVSSDGSGGTSGGSGGTSNGTGGTSSGSSGSGGYQICQSSWGGTGGGYPGDVGGAGTGGVEPASSCDSPIDAWIAFDVDIGNCNRELYAIRPDGTQLTRLTNSPTVESEPYFSPTGDRLSFTSDYSGIPQIYVVDLSSGVTTQVTYRPAGADQSSFSADGQLLAFHSGTSIYTIKPDGSNETKIAGTESTQNAYFNPNFIGNSELMFDRVNEIHAIGVDQTNLREIVRNNTTVIRAPFVSPQRDEIAYQTWCTDDLQSSIWIAQANVSAHTCTGERVTPAQDPMVNANPAWGPESMIVYERVHPYTHMGRITLSERGSGTQRCSLTDGTRDSRNANWSPVGFKF